MPDVGMDEAQQHGLTYLLDLDLAFPTFDSVM